MIDNGFKHEEKIKALMLDTWYDPKYQYYYGGQCRSVYQLPKDGDSHSRHFVSLDSDGNVIGLIGYAVNRTLGIAYDFGAINFTNNKITFAKDLAQVIDEIFTKFGMNKLEFCVICGNPVEQSYDRIVEKIGGRILCVRKDSAKLMDGTICDDKLYEVMRCDYLVAKERRKLNGKAKQHDSGTL